MTLTANEKTAYTLYQAFLDDYAERHFGDRRIGKALLLCSRRTYETLSEEVIDEEQLRSNLRLFAKSFHIVQLICYISYIMKIPKDVTLSGCSNHSQIPQAHK